MIRYSSWNGWRFLLRINSQVQSSSTSAPVAVGLHPTPCSESSDKIVVADDATNKTTSELKTPSESQNHVLPKSEENPLTSFDKNKRSSMVAAAFANLKEGDVAPWKKKHTSMDDRITNAETVEQLLSFAETYQLSRRYALRIVSQLADWTTSGKAKLADFEADARFLKICRMLGKGGSQTLENEATGFGDLAVVLGITGDDEAAKLVAGVSLSQMIRIMSSLAQKQRRSTPLLRSLAFNMAKQTEKLNIKDCADLLYAMSVLNFPDELLLEKTCSDLCECIAENQKPAVVGSIITSLGLLRYKNTETLDVLTEWVAKNIEVCRPQDLTSLLLTLANVYHVPEKADSLFKVILPHVTAENASKPAEWLDVVWSLVVLELATPKHVASVLDPEFQEKLIIKTDDRKSTSVASKLKLLNINAAAQLLVAGYKGPLLPPDSEVRTVPLVRSRDKQLLVASVMDSFSNLLPSATYLQTNINTGMGFLLDGECLLDSKCNPLPVAGQESTPSSSSGKEGDKKTNTSADKKPMPKAAANPRASADKGTRIGILTWDYRDMCRGSPEPNGVAVLSSRLLEKAGYKVLSIPYTEYNPREKLVRRVQYLDRHLKALVKGS